MSESSERVSRALILRRVDYGDADVVLTVLTESYGKRTVFARGARKSKRRFGGALDPFRLIEVRYRERDTESMARLYDATVIEGFDALTADLHRLCWAGVALEWTGAMAVEGEPSAVFETTVELLRWLGQEERGQWYREAGSLRYGLILLAHSGYLPALRYCARTGTQLDEIAQPCFSYLAGGLLDELAVEPPDRAQPVSREAVQFLADLCEGRFPADRNLDVLREARRLVIGIFRTILDKEPKSLEMLRSMWL